MRIRGPAGHALHTWSAGTREACVWSAIRLAVVRWVVADLLGVETQQGTPQSVAGSNHGWWRWRVAHGTFDFM